MPLIARPSAVFSNTTEILRAARNYAELLRKTATFRRLATGKRVYVAGQPRMRKGDSRRRQGEAAEDLASNTVLNATRMRSS
ncbi:hypothetical protein IE4872_PC00398 (plasmid) [Rhizobium gallicum]|uniref:Uncharacterized protein n=1 Tax=Rhizobium gallicum TaxID=56730 RepID=A0A1L5NR95_9HYPH|nr:hypothetical protein IE4872_PC00398 [Rhizobium gallicum]